MTIVQIWKVKSGVDGARAVESVLKCADDSTFPNYDRPNRIVDASNFVQELVRRHDRCASGANTKPNGLKLTVKSPLSNDARIEFAECFQYDIVSDKSPVQLKLFRVSVTQKVKSPIQATVQNITMMILAVDTEKVIDVLADKYPKCSSWDIKIREIEGPFASGQILLDDGIHTISTITDRSLIDI